MVKQHIPSMQHRKVSAFMMHLLTHGSFGERHVTHPLPGLLGLVIAPTTPSVARVAFRGSDSNQRLRICRKTRWSRCSQENKKSNFKTCAPVRCCKPSLSVQLKSHKSLESLFPELDLYIQQRTQVHSELTVVPTNPFVS